MAANDKLRYNKEMEQFTEKGFFINEKGENSKTLYQPKMSDDIVKPKKPSSAYIFFNVEHGKKVREANPGQSSAETSKLVAEVWNSLA